MPEGARSGLPSSKRRLPKAAAPPSPAAPSDLRHKRARSSGPPRDDLPGGAVHALPADLREALLASSAALVAWRSLTPLARNEFICWVSDAKLAKTRERRVRRAQEELLEGMRRPCCWPGCKHRVRNGH